MNKKRKATTPASSRTSAVSCHSRQFLYLSRMPIAPCRSGKVQNRNLKLKIEEEKPSFEFQVIVLSF